MLEKFIKYFSSAKTENNPTSTKTYNDTSDNVAYGPVYPIINKKWDGEKTLGELGMIINNIPDYHRLRARAYDAEMKIDIVNIITGRYFKWVIGAGLKLQSEPNKTVLELEGVSFDNKKFSKDIEARFSIWANSQYSDYKRLGNLHTNAMDSFSTAFLGGDCLVICRIEPEGLSVQVIDGGHVKTPTQDLIEALEKNGNYEQNGIEFNQRGEHVAYYVEVKEKNKSTKFDRISAKGEKTKRKLAWMVYGSRHRVDHTRGITRLSHVLEKINKLDRYTEATVSKAEQGANVLFTVQHDENAIGDNPFQDIVKNKMRLTQNVDGLPTKSNHELADGLANRIMETTSNQTFNLPPGSKLVPYQSDSESNFDAFYKAVFAGICASIGVPPEVAMQQYNSNYSASRAAINGWGYIVDIDRKKHTDDFYKPIFGLFLEVEILKGKIEAPKFVESMINGDYIITDSYKTCRFLGKNMPHIDPLKEVKAVREMIDGKFISNEQATEILNLGSWEENYSKFVEESKEIEKNEPKKDIENANTKR